MIAGSEIVADARRYLGAPYELGGRTVEGLDCVGLVMLIARDFGFPWECETPIPDAHSGVDWEQVSATLDRFSFQHVAVTDAQVGDLLVMRVPLGGAGTVKIISGLGGLTSFFGVARLIGFRTVESVLEEMICFGLADMCAVKRELRMDVQDYVRRLWRVYRYPFIVSGTSGETGGQFLTTEIEARRSIQELQQQLRR